MIIRICRACEERHHDKCAGTIKSDGIIAFRCVCEKCHGFTEFDDFYMPFDEKMSKKKVDIVVKVKGWGNYCKILFIPRKKSSECDNSLDKRGFKRGNYRTNKSLCR